MEKNIQQKLPLIVAFGIPLTLLVWVLVFGALLPAMFVNPQYDVVYATGPGAYNVAVQNGTVVTPNCPEAPPTKDGLMGRYVPCEVTFYRYNVSTEENTQLSEEEVLALDINTADESPDGYRFSRPEGGDNIFSALFGSRSWNDMVITKGFFSKKARLVDDARSFHYEFIGWVSTL